MAFNPKHYPPNWQEIRSFVLIRAFNRCECMGHCGRHGRSKMRRCEEMNGKKAKWANGKVVLTIAHLCHHQDCDNVEHLMAACNRCHLRYDRFMHLKSAARKRLGNQTEFAQSPRPEE